MQHENPCKIQRSGQKPKWVWISLVSLSRVIGQRSSATAASVHCCLESDTRTEQAAQWGIYKRGLGFRRRLFLRNNVMAKARDWKCGERSPRVRSLGEEIISWWDDSKRVVFDERRYEPWEQASRRQESLRELFTKIYVVILACSVALFGSASSPSVPISRNWAVKFSHCQIRSSKCDDYHDLFFDDLVLHIFSFSVPRPVLLRSSRCSIRFWERLN